MGKYDLIDKHYHDSREVLADLVGAELHERCVRFPPPVEDDLWADAAFARRFRLALPRLPAPDDAMVALLCTFLDLEVEHEIELLDQQVRSGAIQAACPSADHVETFHFLWRVLLHHLEDRAAAMHVGFKRADKKRVVASLRERGARTRRMTSGDLQ
ncbi:MAG: hypothetical protein HY904_09675 [Deltaproteobacteria bacterium]|nr:hypothetical protein [Deltaproteobacteria bacterium]